MPTLLELSTQRNELVVKARAINEKALAEKREMTAEENVNFDKYMDDSDALKAKIDEARSSENRSKRLNDAEKDLSTRNGRKTDPIDPALDPSEKRDNVFKFEKRGKFRGFCATPSTTEIRLNDKVYVKPEARNAYRNFLRDGSQEAEVRNLQMDLDTSGGYLVAPQEFVARLIAAVDDLVFIRQLATTFTLTTAATMGVPSRDADIADSDWTAELLTGSEDTALAFGKRELQPHPLAKRIKVSNKLLRAGALDPEAIVRDRLSYKFGITQEKSFLTGSGVQQPLGVFTASALGISTGRDVVTGSTTNITANGLINAKYTLKPQYYANARWGFHRNAISKIRQLTDTNGQYIWTPGGIGQSSLSIGAADLILGLPYFISEYVPSTFTSGLYVGILGDFSFYWIADALSMQVQRLVELYAATNQTGFIARAEVDGMPVLEEAFVRCITN